MGHIRLSFLGPFRAERDGTAVALPARRGRAMLAALALAPGGEISRERLAALFWPDRAEPQARASLRQELSALRRALDGCDALGSSAEAVALRPGRGLETDLWAFLGAQADAAGALALWRGPLLDGVELGSEPYEAWRAAERRRLEAFDPLNEAAVAARMQAAAAGGRVPEALALYAAHAERLSADLAAEPGAALSELRGRLAAATAAQAAPAAPAPAASIFKRPSVLLAGFEALSASEDDRLLALGLADELRLTLAYWRWFPVIGPEAVGWHAGQGGLPALAREVGAAYAVTGTVRRAGPRVRVTACLLSAASGETVWSRNVDGTLEDIFAFQEVASRSIVAQLEPELAHAEAERIARARPNDLSVWQLLVQAKECERRGGEGYGTREANDEQMRLSREALALQPDFARAWSCLAHCHWRETIMGWAESREAAIEASLAASKRAIALDPADWEARAYRAIALLFGRRDFAQAELNGAEAVRLNPSAAQARHGLGCVLENLGRFEKSLEHLHAVFRLNPNHPNTAAVLGDIVTCNMFLGRHREATEAAERLIAVAPGYSRGLQRCVAALAIAGEAALAEKARRRLAEVQPDFSEAYVRETYPFAEPAHLEAMVEGLKKAGCWQ